MYHEATSLRVVDVARRDLPTRGNLPAPSPKSSTGAMGLQRRRFHSEAVMTCVALVSATGVRASLSMPFSCDTTCVVFSSSPAVVRRRSNLKYVARLWVGAFAANNNECQMRLES